MSRVSVNNKHFRVIVEEIMEETGYTETRVLNAIRHFFDWQRGAFRETQYASYLWPRFGTFTYFNYPMRGRYFPEADEYSGIPPRPEMAEQNKIYDELQEGTN